MNESVTKSSDIVGLSITEILLIIIFGLVLVAQLFNQRVLEEQAKAENLKNATIAAKQLDKIVDDLNKLTGKSPTDERSSPQLSERISRLGKDISQVNREIRDLIETSARQDQSLPDVWTELVRTMKSVRALGAEEQMLLDRAADVVEEYRRMKSERVSLAKRLEGSGFQSIEDIVIKLSEVNRQNKFLKSEIRSVRNELNERGFGKQPCWTDELGQIQYLMEVQIEEGSLVTNTIIPDERAEDLEELPLRKEWLDQRFSFPDFKTAFRPIFKHSMENDCRFYVQMVDTGAETKEGYKSARRAIESRFFISDRG